jgi:hypothetical protein
MPKVVDSQPQAWQKDWPKPSDSQEGWDEARTFFITDNKVRCFVL